MQNYFRETARGLREYIKKHPDAPKEAKEDFQHQIKAYETLGECEDIDRYYLFNSGAFNAIIKGYVEMLADELEGLTQEQRSGIKGKIAGLLDRYTAGEAEAYYNNH